ncbi:hypothetical protein [Mesorhizobium sp. WSM3859]|uniref:ATP-dependent DNA ligase n=1 Tax=Mesorhizobium sp. WSM3859 TaxID=2029402 RepID=UPI0032AFB172
MRCVSLSQADGALTSRAAPKGDGWSHEIKFDGYRTQPIKDEDAIQLYTKTGINCTSRYRPTAAEAANLKAESFIIEGEMIVTNYAGLSDFDALRSAITRRPQDLYLVAFDLLHLNGHDLRDMPLSEGRATGADPGRRPHPVFGVAAGHWRRCLPPLLRGQP